MDSILSGRQPILEALKSGVALEKILVLYGTRGESLRQIRALAKQRGVPFSEVSKQRFLELAPDAKNQGVLAIVSSTRYVEVDDILDSAEAKGASPFVLILDEIEDPHNLGALIRTAECAGVHGVIVPKHHSASISQTVAKASAGASLHVPLARVTNVAQLIEELKQKGFWIVGADMSGAKRYDEVEYTGPIAVVVGNEGKGIRRLVKEKCDFLVRIPMYGKIGSLNASVAGALILYEVARARAA